MTQLEKCLMHIGLHKTGTTQIQELFHINIENLKTSEIACSGRFGQTCHQIYNMLYQSKPGVEEWIERMTGTSKSLIFSNEDIIGKYNKGHQGMIYPKRKVYLNRFINALPNHTSVELLLSVREYGSWFESSY